MAGVVGTPSGVPRIPLRRADDLIGRIEALIADANGQGLGTLAYFLGIALTEAQIQARQQDEDREAAGSRPDELWRPVIERSER
jgi:hypothetical protein